MILLDTDVLIECLRGATEAQSWLNSQATESFGIPGAVAMELVTGCRNPQELAQTRKFLSSFPVIWPGAAEFENAFELLTSLRLSSGLGIPDCLIAASALAQGARLYTFNLKHFRAVPGLDAQQPYSRSS